MVTIDDIMELENKKRDLVTQVDAINSRKDLGHYEKIMQGNALYAQIFRIEKKLMR